MRPARFGVTKNRSLSAQEFALDSSAGSIVKNSFAEDRSQAKKTTRDRPTAPETTVSAAGFGPATHALKKSPNQFELTTCMSSYLHPWQNNINEIQTEHRSGCPEAARNPASRTISLRFPGSFCMRRNHFAEPLQHSVFAGTESTLRSR